MDTKNSAQNPFCEPYKNIIGMSSNNVKTKHATYIFKPTPTVLSLTTKSEFTYYKMLTVCMYK